MNVQCNDIVYFKYYSDKQKGIISGDGIANNKLECVSIKQGKKYEEQDQTNFQQENEQNFSEKETQYLKKNAALIFRKCLFRVKCAPKYTNQNLLIFKKTTLNQKDPLLNNMQTLQIEDLEKAAQEEIEENQRFAERSKKLNLIYGQQVQLEHLYSGCILTINPDVLAYEYCCKEASLEETANEWSNFIIKSANNSKKLGEPIMYLDQIALFCAKDPNFAINISQNNELCDQNKNSQSSFDYGLEVNSTDKSAPLKIYQFMDSQTEEDRKLQKINCTSTLESGEVVYLINKRVKISMDKIVKNDTLDDQIQSLWEIQKIKSFDSTLAEYSDFYRIKNVWTGLYLCIQNNEISLCHDGNLEQAWFQFQPKKSVLLTFQNVQFQQKVKIQQEVQGQVYFVKCGGSHSQGLVQIINKYQLNKEKRDSAKFEIIQGKQKLIIQHLENFLQQDSKLKMKQKILLDAGIINILLYIVKLIHFKIYGQKKEETEQYNIPGLGIQIQEIPEKTAQKIAQLKLQNIVTSLYNILNLCIRGNQDCASYLLNFQDDNFLIDQLKYHKEPVTLLLKEAVRYAESGTNEINVLKWIQKLQTVSEENIQEQTFIIELLSLSITDPLENSISQFQHACRKQLFRQKKFKNEDYEEEGIDQITNPIEISLFNFSIEDKKPIIIFNCKNSQQDFLEKNQNLCNLYKKARTKNIDFYDNEKNNKTNQSYYNYFDLRFLNKFAEIQLANRNSNIVEKYEYYALEVLNLYSQLSKNRNYKIIQYLNSIGLTKEFVYLALQEKFIDKNNILYYKAFLNIYQSLVLDCQPLIKISEYSNYCFLSQDLRKFNFQNDPTYKLFREIVVEQKIKTQINKYLKNEKNGIEFKEYNMLEIYANCVVGDENQNNMYSLNIQEDFLSNTEEIPQRLNIDYFLNQKKISDSFTLPQLSEYMMDIFLSMLKIIKFRIDLGYNTQQQNNQILQKIPNLFFAYIDFKSNNNLQNFLPLSNLKQQNFKNYQQNWIYKFIFYHLKQFNQELLIIKVKKINFQTIYISFFIFLKRCIQKLYKQLVFQINQKQVQKQYNFLNLSTLIFKQIEYIEKGQRLEEPMLKLLIESFNYNKQVESIVKKIQIIENEYELDIFKKINGLSENHALKSPKEIEYLTKKTIQFMKLYQQNNGNLDNVQIKLLNNYKESFSQLQQCIESINGIFKLQEEDEFQKQNYQKNKNALQNIIRNSNIQKYLIDLINNCVFEDSYFLDFFRKLVCFLETYIENNSINKLELIDNLENILKLAYIPYDDFIQQAKFDKQIQKYKKYQPLKISKLCISLLKDIKCDFNLISDKIDIIYNQITNNSPFIEHNIENSQSAFLQQINNAQNIKNKLYKLSINFINCQAIIQFFKILKSLTFKQYNIFITSNQMKIINFLLKNSLMQDILKPISVQYIMEFQERIYSQEKDKMKIKLHCQSISLLTMCCKYYRLGIQEVQRFMMYNVLKSVILYEKTPYIIKRIYLRCLFEAYINKIYDIETNISNETISAQDLNEILINDIIPQLDKTNIFRYMDGLIKIKRCENTDQLYDVRKQLIKEKILYFEKNLEFQTLIHYEKSMLNVDYFKRKYNCILDDCYEFWKYLFKDGVAHFIIDCYDESLDDLDKQNPQVSSLDDNFSIIKSRVTYLRETFDILEKDFRVRKEDINLDYYKQFLKQLEEIIPSKQIIKVGYQFIIKKQPGIIGQKINKKCISEYEIICERLLKLLQLMCENVNTNFQKFFRKQTDDKIYMISNYNLVLEVSNLLCLFLEDEQLSIIRKSNLIMQFLDTLNEFSTGENDNQKIICQNKRLFNYINDKIFKNQISFKIKGREVAQDDSQSYQLNLLSSSYKFLLTIIVGNNDKDALKYILEQIDLNQQISLLKQIYDERIKPKKRQIILEDECYHDQKQVYKNNKIYCNERYCQYGKVIDEDKLIIEIGFNIFIIFSYLKESFPEKRDLQIFLDEDIEEDENQKDDEGKQKQFVKKEEKLNKQIYNEKKYQTLLQKNFSQRNSFLTLQQNKNEDYQKNKTTATTARNDKNKQEESQFKRTDEFFKFYIRFLGCTEIVNQKNEIVKVYFKKPFISAFLSENVKNHLIFQSSRETNNERLEFLLNYKNFYQLQLNRKQEIQKQSKIISFFCNNWRIFKDISYFLVIIITITVITTYEDKNDGDGIVILQWVDQLNQVITIIQLIISFIVVIFCAYERYPISIHKFAQDEASEKIEIIKENAGFFKQSIIDQFMVIFSQIKNTLTPAVASQNIFVGLILVCLDFENVYNLVYLILTFYAYFQPLVYSFILLDIVKRSEDLQNVISSITKNATNLLKFVCLGLIILYIYGIIAFQNFPQQFDEEAGAYSYNFIIAIASTIKEGLKSGGGMGDALKPVSYVNDGSNIIWQRYAFDLSFFVIINMLFIQIIFGIILDTFGQLRDNRNELLDKIYNYCFVCGLNRDDIDSQEEKGWYNHIYKYHNCYQLLYYLIYIEKKNENNCDSLEKYCKKLMDLKDISFLPIERTYEIEQNQKAISNEKEEI
ncbi:hypothetical protein IMG5_135140 [Ichthyophthirius multifiliis]|uniref:MIR domain protein n=1 Tax=Ichthyophthirius multifiliis TaxID=5932 RepID=G0QWU2_ICHMU|nr:hypothetical protein IMG5_135140 [Ichthyophthirius multifiliis]EGR30317.1 hypothetical protein IMG5_135140 [Ichthyophthirius multifiliis]|eukprot:XP_004031904.1 hypothetical protein IMG5_135140 [Ichthyophthirius multifiliis]